MTEYQRFQSYTLLILDELCAHVHRSANHGIGIPIYIRWKLSFLWLKKMSRESNLTYILHKSSKYRERDGISTSKELSAKSPDNVGIYLLELVSRLAWRKMVLSLRQTQPWCMPAYGRKVSWRAGSDERRRTCWYFLATTRFTSVGSLKIKECFLKKRNDDITECTFKKEGEMWSIFPCYVYMYVRIWVHFDNRPVMCVCYVYQTTWQTNYDYRQFIFVCYVFMRI